MQQYYIQRFFDGDTLHDNCVLSIENGVIKAVDTNHSVPQDALDGVICPGFIDTQVNGGGGFLLNHDQSCHSLKGIVEAHRQFGTTAMLPTLITDKQSKMIKAADTVARAIATGHQSVIGVHFEGPHLSTTKRGIHASESMRPVDDVDINLYLRKDLGKVMLTIAPENISTDIIKELSANGVLISLGHSNADMDTVLAAVEAGATGFTHLFNAMSGLKAREPGVIGAALTLSHTYAGLIADMQHVHPANCRLAADCIGERLMLVTDAMAHVGSTLQEMNWENTVISRHEDKLLTRDGTLAGSCLDMASAVKNMVMHVGIDLAKALKMATHTPARFMGLSNRGLLKPGFRADFIQLNHELTVQQCWIGGEAICNKNN